MPLHVVVYEDTAYRKFLPLAYSRPVYTLRAGIVPLFVRLKRFFGEIAVSFSTRDNIGPFLSETHRDIPVNIVKRGDSDLLFVNGRLRGQGNLPELVDKCQISTMFSSGNDIAAVFVAGHLLKHVPPIATPADFVAVILDEWDELARVNTTATLFRGIWDLIADIDKEITDDFRWLSPGFGKPTGTAVHSGAYLINPDQIYLGDMVTILPGAIIDASNGPVYIGINCRIEPHAFIVGPTAIGANCSVFAGKVSGSSIGHTCRIGGEVEESIFHAYVNKYHAGFIGHSYVGQWVNFGAMTTNSDLKNNYTPIRVSAGGSSYDTGSIKIGSFIGDHTKLGIGTLMNTGVSIGPASNIFGGGLVTDKEVAPFSWGSTGSFRPNVYDKAIDALVAACERRNHQLSSNEKALLKLAYDGTLSDKGIIQWPETH